MKCLVTLPDGSVCGQVAVVTDPTRGCPVCEEHRPAGLDASRMRFWGHIVPAVTKVVKEWEERRGRADREE